MTAMKDHAALAKSLQDGGGTDVVALSNNAGKLQLREPPAVANQDERLGTAIPASKPAIP